MLEVMLEKIDKESLTLADWIVKQLDIPNLLKGMLCSWQCYSRASPARNSLFRAYHALRRISEYQNISVDELGICLYHYYFL